MEIIGFIILLCIAVGVAEGAVRLINKLRGTEALETPWHVAVHISTYSLALIGTLLLITSGTKAIPMVIFLGGMFVAAFGLLIIYCYLAAYVFERWHPTLRAMMALLFLCSYVGIVMFLGKMFGHRI